MKLFYKIIKMLFCIIASCYLTYLLANAALTTKLQIAFVFLYFIVISTTILFLYNKYLENAMSGKNKRDIAVVSLLSTIIVLAILGNNVFPKHYIENNIKISSCDEENMNSLGNEVWISQIKIDNSLIDLSKLPLDNGWTYKPESNVIYANMDDLSFSTLNVVIEKADKIDITFVKHAWSGEIKISNGAKDELIDLYDKEGNSYNYTVNGSIEKLSWFMKLFDVISLGLILYSIIYIILVAFNGRLNGLYALTMLLTIALLNFVEKYYQFNISVFTILLILLSHYIFINIIKNELMKKYFNIKSICFLLLPHLYLTFTFVGEKIFLPINKVEIQVTDFILFLLIAIVILPVDYCLLYLFEGIVNKHHLKSKKEGDIYKGKFNYIVSTLVSIIYMGGFGYLLNEILVKYGISANLLRIFILCLAVFLAGLAIFYIVINIINIMFYNYLFSGKKIFLLTFLSTFMILLITLLICNPGLMTVDSFDQYAQAHGLAGFSDHHPIFHTFCEKILYTIWDSPFSIAIAQILLFALVIAFSVLILYKCGCNSKVLFAYVIINGIIPGNNVNSVTLWKDIPYSIMLLALTALIGLRLLKHKKFYSPLNTILCIAVTAAIGLLRHNGMIIVAGMIIFFIIDLFMLKSLKPILICIGSMLLLIGTKDVLVQSFNVTPNGTIASIIPIHGMAYINYMNEPLDNDVELYLKEYMPLDVWKKEYYPYSANSYMYSETATAYNTMSLFENTSLKKVITLYLETFLEHPYLIIKDRLYGTDILWNVKQGQGYNYRYAYVNDINNNSFGISNAENKLSNVYFKILSLTTHNIFDIFFWRVGIYIDILILLIYFCFINRNSKLVVCMLPIILNTISLFIAMAWQDYRYVYNVNMCFGFILVFILSNLLKVDKNYQNYEEK